MEVPEHLYEDAVKETFVVECHPSPFRRVGTEAKQDSHHDTRRLAAAGGPGDEPAPTKILAGPLHPSQFEHDRLLSRRDEIVKGMDAKN